MSQQQEPGDVHYVYPATDELTAHQARDAILSHDAVRPHDHGLEVRETESDGRCVATASAGNQVLAQYTVKESTDTDKMGSPFTIGQVLEAVVRTAGDEPINKADAAAVQAAEARAIRHGNLTHGSLRATAQDKAVRRDDAERVKAAEERNEEEGHVADAIAAAASFNEKRV